MNKNKSNNFQDFYFFLNRKKCTAEDILAPFRSSVTEEQMNVSLKLVNELLMTKNSFEKICFRQILFKMFQQGSGQW